MPRPAAAAAAKGLLLALVLSLAAACGSPGSLAPVARATKPAPGRAADLGPARFFHGLPEESFWVSHTDALDRVIAAGARLELLPSAEVVAAAWDMELANRGDMIQGGVEIPKSQGGGFVYWSRTRVFRSREFTGELEPVVSADSGIRGARPGWRSIVVITEAGPREILPGSHKLTPFEDPGLIDAAATDASHAIRLDVFGRASTTTDGGKRWTDLSPTTGISARGITLSDHDIHLETWQGRFVMRPDGKAALDPTQVRSYYDPTRGFQIAWKGSRAGDREDWPWGYREATPLQAAVFAGADAGDGTALGVIQGVTVRVDLATGKLVSLASDWIPSGLGCQPIRAPDGVLLACAWERYQGYGGYLLKSAAGGAPEIERAFTDEGGFVGDDDGALGYTGSCRVRPRLFDPEDMGRGEYQQPDEALKPVFCVRKSDGIAPEWVERAVDVGTSGTLVAWIPRRDGTAVALVLSNDPLPPPSRGDVRVSDQGGVRVIRVYREIESFAFNRGGEGPSSRGLVSVVDKRFTIREDGSIDGWLSPSQDNYQPIHIGVTLGEDGRPTVHEMPPGAALMAVTGDHGIAIAARGELYETLDHGRSWRAAGASPIPPSALSTGGCSAFGCVLGPVVRFGWGDGKLAAKINLPKDAAESALGNDVSAANDSGYATPPGNDVPTVSDGIRLLCTPAGDPAPMVLPPPAPPGARQVISTSYGDAIEIVREKDAPEPTPQGPAGPLPFPFPPQLGMPFQPSASATVSPSAAPAAGRPPKSAPVLRTHSLLFRPPFEPTAPARRLNATDATFTVQRRSVVTPLLGDAGVDVSLLVAGDTTELMIAGDKISSMPSFEPRRYSYSDAAPASGLRLPGGHAYMLGDIRRRLTLEEHGASPPPPPIYLGVERDQLRRRPMTLGRRDDGAVGVLIFDGAAPETVGVAEIDRTGESARAIQKLAPWSTAIPADDPRCRADRDAYRALLVLDPSTWFALDAAALPGVVLARQGMALVRWGKERVCVEAIDMAVSDSRRKGDGARSWSLVVRWGGKGSGGGGKNNVPAVNAALRAADLRQELRCAMPPRAR